MPVLGVFGGLGGGPRGYPSVYIIGILALGLPAYSLRKWVYTIGIHNVIHPVLGVGAHPGFIDGDT